LVIIKKWKWGGNGIEGFVEHNEKSEEEARKVRGRGEGRA
jgi:hypothetical protein